MTYNCKPIIFKKLLVQIKSKAVKLCYRKIFEYINLQCFQNAWDKQIDATHRHTHCTRPRQTEAKAAPSHSHQKGLNPAVPLRSVTSLLLPQFRRVTLYICLLAVLSHWNMQTAAEECRNLTFRSLSLCAHLVLQLSRISISDCSLL